MNIDLKLIQWEIHLLKLVKKKKSKKQNPNKVGVLETSG